MVTKLTTILLFVNIFTFSVKSYCQEIRVTLNMKDVSISSVLDEISDQSGYTFAWSSKFVDVDKKVDFECGKCTLVQALNRLFDGTNIRYEFVDKKVILIPEELKTIPRPNGRGDISGTVKSSSGKILQGVNIAVKGTSKGTITDSKGVFELDGLADGTYELVVSFVGFKSLVFKVDVFDGKLDNVNIKMAPDMLNLNTIVVTGVQNPESAMRSSVAITTMSSTEVEKLNTSNAAKVLEFVPGFYLETSGGDVGNNLFVRGIPSAGAYQFVQIQENGLPVFEDGALQFSNADNYFRIDANLDRIEAVRGGSSSIFASNSPGGIVNLISKTGGPVLRGFAKISSADYGMLRTDLNVNGPLSKNIRFSIGGFYRYGNGVRDAGFAGNKGGQLKANFTFLHKNGYIRTFFKFLNDRNIFYLPIPIQNQSHPASVPGFNANYGTLASIYDSKISVPMVGGGTFTRDLQNGIHPIVTAIGAELFQNLTQSWTIKNAFRFTNIDLSYDAMFSMGNPLLATDLGNSVFGDGNYQYSYVDNGKIISNPASMNGNGLVVQPGFWSVDRNMNNFADKLSITKKVGAHHISAGYYFSHYAATQFWYWSQVLMEVAIKPHLLNLTDLATGRSYTWNGISNIGFYGRNSFIEGLINAIYLDDEFNIGENLSAEVGVRYEMNKYSGSLEGDATGNLPDQDSLLTPALNTAWVGSGRFKYFTYNINRASWTVGLNYLFSKNTAVYVRASSGFRAPVEESFMDNISNESNLKPTFVNQYELGCKHSSSTIAVFANAFFMAMKNLPFTDILANGQSENKFASARNLGLELETIVKFGIFGFQFNGTLQSPQFSNFQYHNTANGTLIDNNGKQVRRIPKIFFHLEPALDITHNLNVYIRYSVYGKKFQDNENLATLPGYTVFDAGASYQLQAIRFAITGNNLCNTIGLTEGDPRTSPNTGAYYYMARPILGRNYKFSISYQF